MERLTDTISWAFRTHREPPQQLALARKVLFDLAKLLEIYSLARVEEEKVVIGDWSLGFAEASLPSSNTISLTTGEGAGFIRRDDGPWPLLLLLAFKRRLPEPCSLTVALPDGVEVSDQLKLEQEVLTRLGSDLDRVRPIAEALGLLPPRFYLNQLDPDAPDYYF